MLAIAAQKNRQAAPKQMATAQRLQRIYEYSIGQDYARALDLISRRHRMVITFVFTLKPQYIGMFTV